jgi:hypothetical protein
MEDMTSWRRVRNLLLLPTRIPCWLLAADYCYNQLWASRPMLYWVSNWRTADDAVNDMIDVTTTRTMSARIHPPVIVFLMLGALALCSSLLAGYAMGTGKTRSPFHRLAFALVVAATVYVIVDLEYPRFGLIRMDAADTLLEDMQKLPPNFLDKIIKDDQIDPDDRGVYYNSDRHARYLCSLGDVRAMARIARCGRILAKVLSMAQPPGLPKPP